MKRFTLLIQLSSVIALFVLGSQSWAEAIVTDQEKLVSISGLEAYPQMSIGITILLLISLVSRYVKSLFGKFLLSAVAFLVLATLAPVWFESSAGSLSILGPQIGAITGVSDWEAQASLITQGVYNHLASDLFVIALIFCFVSTLLRVWQIQGAATKVSLTRIDQLPKW